MSGTRTETSPDGRFEVEYWLSEGLHSQWRETPRVRDLAARRTVFELQDESFDASVEWHEEPGRFTLFVRRWPDGAYGLAVHVDVDAGTVRLGEEEEAQPLAKAERLVVRHFDERRRPARPISIRRGPEPKAPIMERVLDWVSYAFVALIVIGGFALWMGWLPDPAPRP
ncbi:hypothetical protein [Erythrobacter sp.]|uniref:hypothetical protein n=1 Tax=Erythrobacter sp. TaxID=1042 RepID=UPI001425E7FC|nr:hypothetical protein [Erythrobacter sp.]QIQ87386.1 MAG: hypothetical protein G9473_12340 [Erythrobacter sp.]